MSLFVLASVLPAAAVPASPRAASPGSVRLEGADRYATAAAVSRFAYPSGADIVHVASGEVYADALAAAPSAARHEGPVLLVTEQTVPDATSDELERLGPDAIVLVGGVSAVGDAVFRKLSRYADDVRRIAGRDRYETASKLAVLADGDAALVLVASGEGFADALTAGAAGAEARAPIVLVARHGVPIATSNALSQLRPARIVVVGGVGAIDEAVLEDLRQHARDGVTRWAGEDRYATSAAASAEMHPGSSSRVAIASGQVFADAIASAPLAAAGIPLILSPRACMPSVTREEVQRLAPSELLLVGGVGALGPVLARLMSCRAPIVGTNFTHHEVNGCSLDDTGIVLTYHENGVRARVREQLRTMVASGVRSLRLIVWHTRTVGAHRWGVVSSSQGQLPEPYRSNLGMYIDDIRASFVEQLTISIAPQGVNNPVRSELDRSLRDENWGIVADVRRVAQEHNAPSLHFDLLNEGAGPAAAEYISEVYTRYADAFGTGDVTVSTVASQSAIDTEGRLQSLVDALRRSGRPLPRWFEVHLAYTEEGARLGLRTVDEVLRRNGLTQPLVVGETAYNDDGVAASVAAHATMAARPITEVLQWPLTSDHPCKDISVSPPYVIDAYLDEMEALT